MKSILLYTLIGCCLLACSSVSDSQLEQALQLSGENRPQLEAVLDFYKNDSLKLKAACYLIKNMPYHYSVDEYYRSPDGQKYRPDIAVFKDKEEMERHCDSLARRGYRTERHKVFDLVSLDSAYLVDNIELAFSVWQKPWAKNISFDDFCGYILPYRAQTEKASLLRRKLMERFMPMLDSARVSTPLEACILLNERLKEIVRYQDTGLPFYPTIDETYRAGIGLCEGICNLGAFVMRAVGIPVAIEFTLWSKMDLGHNWCAVLSDGRFYSFGPGEEQPGAHAERLIEKYYLQPAARCFRYALHGDAGAGDGDPVRHATGGDRAGGSCAECRYPERMGVLLHYRRQKSIRGPRHVVAGRRGGHPCHCPENRFQLSGFLRNGVYPERCGTGHPEKDLR